LTPAQIVATAEVIGSPALLALVRGHLANGHPALAETCLRLPLVKLAMLDAVLERAKTK